MEKNKRNSRLPVLFLTLLAAACILMALYCLCRVFITSPFTVRGESMWPTFQDGEKVWVNKLLMGPRLIPKAGQGSRADTIVRLKGARRPEVGDILVFNMPYGEKWGQISMSQTVYLKRCAACPGDSISIVDGHYTNSRTADTGVPKKSERYMMSFPDDILIESRSYHAGQFCGQDWTVRNFGPLLIPGKNVTIQLDSLNKRLYSTVLEYELHAGRSITGSLYTFQNDYYFVVGDNPSNSKDSRFFGFVPADYIIGIASTKNRRN